MAKKKFKCEKCDKEFDTKKGLRVHESKAHEGSASLSIENPWKLVSIISVILLVVSLFYGFTSTKSGLTGKLTAKEAGEKAVEYIGNLPQMQMQGINISLVNTEETESGVYKIGIKLATPQGDQELDSYVTKDGKYLFPQGMDITQTQETAQEKQSSQQSQEEIPKSKKPKVQLFVMSFCPYGNQAENTMKSVYELLKDKVQWEPHYIVSERNGQISSLHGQSEVEQDKRELCVLEDYGVGKWFDFVTYVDSNCGSSGSCWKDAASKINVSANKISTCAEERGTEMLKEEAKISQEKGATGSPTLFINNQKSSVVYQYGDSEAYKNTICSAFKTEPEECSQKLGNSSSSASSGGSC